MSHYVSSRMSARPGGGGQNTQRQIIKSVDTWRAASSLLQDSSHVMGVYKAALHGDANLLMHIVTAEGLHLINQQDQLGIPPMIYATLSDNPACIERIQELGGRKEVSDMYGRTSVHYAAYFSKMKALKYLLQSASDWSSIDLYGRTPLHWACASKSVKALRFLLEYANSVYGQTEYADFERTTPVFVAVQFCNAQHIEILAKEGHNFLQEDIEGKTAFHWTVDNPNTNCVESLLKFQPELLNKQDGEGKTLLHIACEYNLSHIAYNLLINQGILIDLRDSDGRTPLHSTAISGSPNLTEALLSQKALDSVFDDANLTALHYAVLYKHVQCVNMFTLQENMSHLPDNEFRTPLMYAACISEVPILNALLSRPEIGAQINAQDKQDNTCLLHVVITTQSVDAMRVLLNAGADPNVLNSQGYNALHICCQMNYVESTILLIDSRASVLIPDRNELLSPLHIAVRHSSKDVLAFLALQTDCVNLVTQDGLNALHFAAQMGDKVLVEILLNSPLSSTLINAVDSTGLSPIHHAILKEKTEIVAILCQFGAYLDLQLRDFDSDTCLDLAINNNQQDIINVLKEFDAKTKFELETGAAVVIQTCVRFFLARIQFLQLKRKAKAVTTISAYFKGFKARNFYSDLKRKQTNAVRIQSFYRGFLQRKKFKIDLQKFRAYNLHNFYIDMMHQNYLNEISNSKFKMLTIEDLDFENSLFISPWRSSLREKRQETLDDRSRRLENEQRLRLENSLILRRNISKKSSEWLKFIKDEDKRRDSKLMSEKRLKNLEIVSRSKERRKVITEKYSSIKLLQIKVHSAIVIQRQFRTWVQLKKCKKSDEIFRKIHTKTRENAAFLIQKHWRRYLYRLMERELKGTTEILDTNIAYPLAILSTQPIIPTPPDVKKTKSYLSDTLLTSQPRRKLLMPPSRDVLREAKKDLLSLSLPERNVLALKEIIRPSKPTSVGLLHRGKSLSTVLTIPLDSKNDPFRNFKSQIAHVRSEFELPDNLPHRNPETNRKSYVMKRANSLQILKTDSSLPFVGSETKQIPILTETKSSVTSLPPIVQK